LLAHTHVQPRRRGQPAVSDKTQRETCVMPSAPVY
jgi:hypothetical protein